MKICTICKQSKELEAFNKKATSRDGHQNVCKDCNKKRSRQYYADNRDKHLVVIKQNKKTYIDRNRSYLANYLLQNSCVDCGCSDIRVLQFDHVSGEKLDCVTVIAGAGSSMERLMEEVSKCEVRCANCHIIKTYDRIGGSWHYKYMPVDPDGKGFDF